MRVHRPAQTLHPGRSAVSALRMPMPRRRAIAGNVSVVESRPQARRRNASATARSANAWKTIRANSARSSSQATTGTFAPVLYPRIDDADGYGYIPGDLYCQLPVLLHQARRSRGGADGRQRHDPARLQRPRTVDETASRGTSTCGCSISPRADDTSALISAHDMLQGFPPVERAPDYVVMDVPYLGVSMASIRPGPRYPNALAAA